MNYLMDDQYIRVDPFDGGDRDVDIRCRQVRMVKTRKIHQCIGIDENQRHDIPVGSIVRYESALIDGDYWGRYYICKDCLDRWLEIIGDKP